MCWNEDVSLNTFLFSSFVLLLIIYNNEYTKYKIDTLHNIWMYIFIASIITIQLVEFFIWRNIRNRFYNSVFSIIAIIVLVLQPIFSLMLLTKIWLRNTLLYIYVFLTVPILVYILTNANVHTVISEKGHLVWNFLAKPLDAHYWITWIGWLFFFSFSLFYEKIWVAITCAFLLLVIVWYNYYMDKSSGSIWCWVVNSIMLFYAFYLLIVLPFYEKANIC